VGAPGLQEGGFAGDAAVCSAKKMWVKISSLGQRAGGEGELDRRTVAAGQNVFGTRETEPQNLAALDKNVRAPEKSKMRTHATY
jgi:hypothetical protein